VEATAKVYGVKAIDYAKFRSSAAGRDMAADPWRSPDPHYILLILLKTSLAIIR
jgi:hypothetical protein